MSLPTRPACHRNGGPLRVGTVARLTSVPWPTSRRSAGPLSIGLPGPLPSDFAQKPIPRWPTKHEATSVQLGIRAITLISKSKPASQVTPIAVQFG